MTAALHTSETESFEEIDLNSRTGDVDYIDTCNPTTSGIHNSPNKRHIEKDSKRSWLICLAAFSIQVFDVGVMHIFGVFFVVFLDEFGSSNAEAAWVGSACYGLAMAFGPLSGSLIHKYGSKPVAMTGAFVCSMSMLLSSFVNSLEMLYLTFSLMYGIGCSLAYTPTMCIAGEYFDKYVSFALGIMTAGSSFGTLLLAPLSQVAIDSIGWRHAFRILGGFNLLTMFGGYMFTPAVSEQLELKNDVKSGEPESWWKRNKGHFAIWKSPLFLVWVFAICCVQFGYYIPYVHLVAHAKEIGIPVSEGSTLMMCLGCATCVARILFGKLADLACFRHLYMFQGCIAIQGLAMVLLPYFKTFAALLCYVFLVGLIDGCYVVCMPVLTFKLMGYDRAILAWGFMIGASSVTFTLGPPCAGWIYDAYQSYDISFHVAGVPVLVGAVVLFSIPWLQMRSYGASKPICSLVDQTGHDQMDIDMLGLDLFQQRPVRTLTIPSSPSVV